MEYQPKTIEPQEVTESSTNLEESFDSQPQDIGGLDRFKVAQMFAVESSDYHKMAEVEEISSLVNGLGLKGADALLFIRSLQSRQRQAPIGMSTTRHLLNYLKIYAKSQEFNKQMLAYER